MDSNEFLDIIFYHETLPNSIIFIAFHVDSIRAIGKLIGCSAETIMSPGNKDNIPS